RNLKAGNIRAQLLVHIAERWRNAHAAGNRKRKAVRLPDIMIGILPENDYFHLIKRRMMERIEDEVPGRKYGMLLFFGLKKPFQFLHVGLLKFRCQYGFPTGF